MPSHIVQRRATEAEQAFLRKTHAEAPTTARRRKLGIENALVMWASSLLAIVAIWAGSAWLVRKLFDLDFGLRSPVGMWIWGIAIPLTAIYSVVSSVRWVAGWKDYRPLLQADIDAAQVAEEHYVFTAAKRFQESEYGGFIYFFRTADDKVFTLFDHESQDLGAQGGDPLKSSFVPMSSLIMVKAPQSDWVINKNFSGEVMEAGDPTELVLSPKNWPESERYCTIPWAELDAIAGGGESSAVHG
jgi:hypothetical protein